MTLDLKVMQYNLNAIILHTAAAGSATSEMSLGEVWERIYCHPAYLVFSLAGRGDGLPLTGTIVDLHASCQDAHSHSIAAI